jgi:hypothetical protein
MYNRLALYEEESGEKEEKGRVIKRGPARGRGSHRYRYSICIECLMHAFGA